MTEYLFSLTEAAATTAETAAAGTEAATTATAGIGELLTMFLPLILMFVVFYFLLIRPQRKKDKQVKDMLAALKPGDRVCTIGGFYGTITGIKDDTVELAIGRDDTKMIIARWGIRSVEEVAVENDSEVLN